ncbi:protein SMG5 [Venturia canescens]|uniref:protein SMG5 n=1 Tax=Venturia canescens TaxID=32260 RepID=UPI001C9C0925|nr:protein SMG5 [Venturia canescens]
MRRSFNPKVPDTRTNDCLEITRRLYRVITDISKKLDVQKSCALNVTDIFTPSGEVLRAKLKDYCERLIFKDPVSNACKTEELLWRKGFYDAVSACKKLRKGNTWNETEKALLLSHLAVGVGFYHHLILKLQIECDLDLVGVVDFAYPRHKTMSLSNQKIRVSQNKLLSEEVRQCAMKIIHRSLICLGDLARYRLDVDPSWDPLTATRYYKIAVSIDPNIGMPHNQLGTVAGNRNYGVDAVYHYMRCILCTESFEGAEGNLKRVITAHSYSDKENACSFQKCAGRLFSLLQLWDSASPDSERINHNCQALLIEFEKCLNTELIEKNNLKGINDEDSIENYLQNCKSKHTLDLTDNMIFKIVAICLMSIAKLESKESGEVQGATAFTLTILLQLMQITITRLQRAIVALNLPNSMILDNKENSESYKQNGTSDIEESTKLSDEDRVDLNDNERKKIVTNIQSKTNGIIVDRKEKKSRDKSKKSLLTKLRRPRKRLNSSDSDASEVDGANIGSSSDELNSDISKTEEEEDDVFSDSNVISDDPLSEDFTDDETMKSSGCNNLTLSINGHNVNTNEEIESRNEDSEVNALENGDNTGSEDAGNVMEQEKNMSTLIDTVPIKSNGSFHEDEENSLYRLAQSKKQYLSPTTLIEIFSKEGALESIKICFDWLQGNREIFRMFTKSSGSSLKRVTTLLNLVNLQEFELPFVEWERDCVLSSSIEKLNESVEKVPLPEDIDLRGLKLFRESHEKLDWHILRHTKMYKNEETLLRVKKIIQFGNYLCTFTDSGVKYDEKKKLYITTDIKHSMKEESQDKVRDRDIETEHSRGKLMRHMGQLWLKAEVRALESRLRSKLISPYLVPDQEALAKHTPALKRLVHAKKFIVIIPSVVVSALDEMKKTSSKAREATRWLEGQLRKGSRFLRAQRPHERLPLPLIKGPKNKDKEAWLFFQIIECCHYLTQQTKVGLNGDKEPPVVTLLTGFSVEERKAAIFSPDGLSKTAGVNLEHIESFHTKWKTSSKSHG